MIQLIRASKLAQSNPLQIMKNVGLIILINLVIAFSPNPLQAQEDSIKTLFKEGGSTMIENVGGYGSLSAKFCPDSDHPFWIGLQGGWILNRKFTIGGAGYWLIPTEELNYSVNGNNTPVKYTGGYGGLFLQYTHSSNSVVNFSGNVVIGMGGVSSFDYQYDEYKTPTATFFVVEPGIAADLNLTKDMRISVGVSYKIVPYFNEQKGTSTAELLDKKEFRGPAISLAYKFGKF